MDLADSQTALVLKTVIKGLNSIILNLIVNLLSFFTFVSQHLYADNTQMYTGLTPDNASMFLQVLKECISCIQNWRTRIKLRLNSTKRRLVVSVVSIILAQALVSSKLDVCNSLVRVSSVKIYA